MRLLWLNKMDFPVVTLLKGRPCAKNYCDELRWSRGLFLHSCSRDVCSDVVYWRPCLPFLLMLRNSYKTIHLTLTSRSRRLRSKIPKNVLFLLVLFCFVWFCFFFPVIFVAIFFVTFFFFFHPSLFGCFGSLLGSPLLLSLLMLSLFLPGFNFLRVSNGKIPVIISYPGNLRPNNTWLINGIP